MARILTAILALTFLCFGVQSLTTFAQVKVPPKEKQKEEKKTERVRVVRTIESRLNRQTKAGGKVMAMNDLNQSTFQLWLSVKGNDKKGSIVAVAHGESFDIHDGESSVLDLKETHRWGMRASDIVTPKKLKGQRLSWYRPQPEDWVHKHLCDDGEVLLELKCRLPSKSSEELKITGEVHIIYASDLKTTSVSDLGKKKLDDLLFEDKAAGVSCTVSRIGKEQFGVEVKSEANQVVSIDIKNEEGDAGWKRGTPLKNGNMEYLFALRDGKPTTLSLTYAKKTTIVTKKLKNLTKTLYSAPPQGSQEVAKFDSKAKNKIKAWALRFEENHEWVLGQDARSFWANSMPNRIKADWAAKIPKSKGLPVFYAYAKDFVITGDGERNLIHNYSGYAEDQDSDEPEWQWRRTSIHSRDRPVEGEIHFESFGFTPPRASKTLNAYGKFRVKFLKEFKTKSLGKISEFEEGDIIWQYENDDTSIHVGSDYSGKCVEVHGLTQRVSKLTLKDKNAQTRTLSFQSSGGEKVSFLIDGYSVYGLDLASTELEIEYGTEITTEDFYVDFRDFPLK